MFDYIFILVVICAVIISIISTIIINFIKLKRKKGYVQLIEKETLEENTGIELTETKPEEEEVATD